MKNFKFILIGLILGIFLGGIALGATTLLVPQGGTGVALFPPNSLISSGTSTTNALRATSTPTVNAIIATSTEATSTFAGGVGIGTTSPSKIFSVSTAATTTIYLDSTSATQGTCLKMKNATGTDYTYLTVEYGVLVASTISCE